MCPRQRRHDPRFFARACAGLALLVTLLPACDDRPKKPEDLLAQIERVVTSANAEQAWKLVDPDTQHAVEAVWADHRAAAALLEQRPPAPAANTARASVEAARQPDLVHFFAAQCHGWQLLEGYRKRLGSASGPVQKKEDAPGSVWVARFDGMAFHVVKVGGGWAWADLKGEWQLESRRVKKVLDELRAKPAAPTKNEGP